MNELMIVIPPLFTQTNPMVFALYFSCLIGVFGSAFVDPVHVTDRLTTTRDGVGIFYQSWSVPEPTALVYITHGMAEHSGRYDSFARELALSLNAKIVAHDHRGHGRTACGNDVDHTTNLGIMERRPVSGSTDALTLMAQDTLSLIEATIDDEHDLPIFLFGHSMGSVVARLVLRHADRRIQLMLRGVVLSGVPTVPAKYEYYPLMGLGYAIKFARGIGQEFVQKNLVTGKFDSAVKSKTKVANVPENGFISSDLAAVAAYNDDPLSGHLVEMDILISIAHNLGLMQDAATFFGPLGEIELPFLFISGRDDPVCEFGKTAASDAEKLSALGHRVTEVYIGDCRHEFLNEAEHIQRIGKNQVIAWIKSQLE